jgi:hypothetical protein
MCRVPTEISAAEGACRLAELSDQLNRARDALIGLDLRDEQRLEARELFLRIEAARFEVQSLRLSRSFNERQEKGPEWTKTSAWTDRS